MISTNEGTLLFMREQCETPPEYFSLDDLREYEEQIIRDWNESFPKPGDRMFVPSASGAHIDPIKLAYPGSGGRPSEGRLALYAEGYREAGDRLVDGLRADEMASTPGAALAYPILFCYRHSLELQLKGLIFYVLNMQNALGDTDAEAVTRKEKEVSEKHGLKALWDLFHHLDATVDFWATDLQRTGFLKLLGELDRHDRFAQAARYPIDTKGNQTLSDLSIVDMGNVKKAVNKIARYLETTQNRLTEGVDQEPE